MSSWAIKTKNLLLLLEKRKSSHYSHCLVPKFWATAEVSQKFLKGKSVHCYGVKCLQWWFINNTSILFFISSGTQEAIFRSIPNPIISILITKSAGVLHSRCLEHLAEFWALQFVGLQSYSASYRKKIFLKSPRVTCSVNMLKIQNNRNAEVLRLHINDKIVTKSREWKELFNINKHNFSRTFDWRFHLLMFFWD